MSEVSNGKVIYEGGSGEIEEKKSRFIANIAPDTTEEVHPVRFDFSEFPGEIYDKIPPEVLSVNITGMVIFHLDNTVMI